MAGNSAFSSQIWLKFELIQALNHVLVFCKNEDDPIQNEGTRVLTTFSPLLVYGIFSDAQGQLTQQSLARFWPNFELVRNIMTVLVTEKDPIKNEGARVLTTFNIDLSDAQGQVTPHSVVGSG